LSIRKIKLKNKIRYSLTKKERIKIFLYLHFSYPGWKYVRILGGPFLILVGILLIKSNIYFSIAYGGFAIGFGLYYMLRPFLKILINIKKYKIIKETIEYNNKTKDIKIISDTLKVNIPTERILNIKKLKWGYKLMIKIDNRKHYIVLTKKSIIDGNLDNFIEYIMSNK
jgi:hypothetical protein